jgi:hypothetical protein
MTIAAPLPQSRHRRGRRTPVSERRAQKRVVVLAIVAGVAAMLLVAPRTPWINSASAPTPTIITRPVTGRTLLLAHLDATRHADLVMLVARQPGGRSANVVFVPSRTVVQVPSLDLASLSDVVHDSDRGMLATALENALGIRIDDRLLLDNAGLAALLAPAGTLSVDFPNGVSVEDRSGTLRFAAGRTQLSPADTRRVLLGNEADGALSHIVTVQAVVAGWLAALRNPVVARATLQNGAPTRLLLDAARLPTSFETLPVDSVDSGGAERYQLRDNEVAALVSHDFGFARRTFEGRRPRVEILNGVGKSGITPKAARLLIPAGADVRLTNNVPGFGVAATTVVYYRDGDLAAARAFARALGVGRIARGDTALQVVDLTVVLGNDFVGSHPL